MESTQKQLKSLPSVDELLKNDRVRAWLEEAPRKFVIKALRNAVSEKREDILQGKATDLPVKEILSLARAILDTLTSYSLRPVINATGVVLHTNIGRAPLSKKAVHNITTVAEGYSNLEYNLIKGERGKRYSHLTAIIKELTSAEEAIVVNNNASAVLLCLSALAKGGEVVISRGELVEIGGSFRVPEILEQSGAKLREVGTTNKTHLRDYKNALNDHTSMILKVHQSNYKIIGFTSETDIESLAELTKERGFPLMFDLGSGCLLDLTPYGVHSEPTVQEIVKKGVDILTFSGDKLLGGPQGGIIVGKKKYIETIRNHPLARAVRIDKLTLAALEATFMDYADMERAKQSIPTLRMLLQDLESIKERAQKILSGLEKNDPKADLSLLEDTSQAGGGSLPETEFPTCAVSVKPHEISINRLERNLRKASPPIVARIRDNALLLDARTIGENEIESVIKALKEAL